MTDKKKILLIGAALFLVFVAFLIALISWRTTNAKTEVLVSECDDGLHTAKTYIIGEPNMPYGSVKASFELNKENNTVCSVQFDINNDGKNLDEDNFTVTWGENKVKVAIHSEEQADIIYTLNFDGTVVLGDSDDSSITNVVWGTPTTDVTLIN